MRAVVFAGVGQPLVESDVPRPEPGPGSVRLDVTACGVCRTDLHIVDGELERPKLPLVLGHQIVGTVNALGEGVTRFAVGQRVGVPWLAWTCGRCRFCVSGRENLCEKARFTGYDVDGGFADETVADERYCFPIPSGYPDVEAAPLLCAGLIGYRAYSMTGAAERIGLYGFGAAAHIVCQVALAEGRRVFAFTRPGDTDARRSHGIWVRSGRAGRTSARRRSSTLPSSSQPQASSCPRHSRRPRRAVPSSAREST